MYQFSIQKVRVSGFRVRVVLQNMSSRAQRIFLVLSWNAAAGRYSSPLWFALCRMRKLGHLVGRWTH